MSQNTIKFDPNNIQSILDAVSSLLREVAAIRGLAQDDSIPTNSPLTATQLQVFENYVYIKNGHEMLRQIYDNLTPSEDSETFDPKDLDGCWAGEAVLTDLVMIGIRERVREAVDQSIRFGTSPQERLMKGDVVEISETNMITRYDPESGDGDKLAYPAARVLAGIKTEQL